MKPLSENKDVVTRYDPESFIATQFRRLYHNIKLDNDGREVDSFLITSSNRGEGKSTIISNLGITIAQYPKKKVLIVDADLRRPQMHKLFRLDIGPGMAECLGSGVEPGQVTKKTKMDNLHVITAGGPSSHPSMLFESEALSSFIRYVVFYYDVVLIDSAPVLAVSDTLFLSSEAAYVLFVILAGVTPREVVKRAVQTLDDSKANLSGVVLNNALEVLPYYYDQKYYGS